MGMLDGKVAIITGGTSGIGARTVELFAEQGAKVVVAGRREAEGEAIAARLGQTVSFRRTDMLDKSQVQTLIEHAVERFGRLDCMFNNAGGGGPRTGGIADLDITSFDRHIAINLRTAVLGMKHAARVMQVQRSGSIINTASLAGLRVGYSPLPYSAAKAALLHATRWIANELGPYHIRVNSISPGGIVTGLFAKSGGASETDAAQNRGPAERILRDDPTDPPRRHPRRHSERRNVSGQRPIELHHRTRHRHRWRDGDGKRLADLRCVSSRDRQACQHVIRSRPFSCFTVCPIRSGLSLT